MAWTGAVSGYVTDVLAGAAPAPVLPTVAGPVEREQRRAVSRESGTDIEFAEHTDRATDRGHGRTEHRTLRVAGCDDRLFPGARQVFRLRRDTGASTAYAPAKKSCTASPACPPTWPAPPTSTTTADGTGPWKTVYIGRGMSRSAKSHPRSGPVPHPAR